MCNWNRFRLSEGELSPEEMYKDILTEDEISEFDGWLPSSPHGVHTIESISILNVESKEELLSGDCYYEYEQNKNSIKVELEKVNQCPQNQDSLNTQLIILYHIANKFGLYDAADFIKPTKESRI